MPTPDLTSMAATATTTVAIVPEAAQPGSTTRKEMDKLCSCRTSHTFTDAKQAICVDAILYVGFGTVEHPCWHRTAVGTDSGLLDAFTTLYVHLAQSHHRLMTMLASKLEIGLLHHTEQPEAPFPFTDTTSYLKKLLAVHEAAVVFGSQAKTRKETVANLVTDMAFLRERKTTLFMQLMRELTDTRALVPLVGELDLNTSSRSAVNGVTSRVTDLHARWQASANGCGLVFKQYLEWRNGPAEGAEPPSKKRKRNADDE